MTIKRVGIVGSGIMGSGIAECAAKNGHEVVLRSRQQATADAMVAGLEKALAKQVEKGRVSEEDRTATLDRITATSDLGELASCDLVIESIVEDLSAKRHLFNELDRICGENTIIATNTSTLPVIELAMETGRPDKVCGIHFFNPAGVMSLVEIVRPLTASDETIAEARAFAEACGKGPVDVKDRAGFIVNALLFPYLNNAVRLLEAGVATKVDIDYILGTVNTVLATPLTHADIDGVYAGLRPLLAGESEETSKLSREHAVAVPAPGLVAIAGGKYTTYRVMAADAIDAAAQFVPARVAPSITEKVSLLGADGYFALVNQVVWVGLVQEVAERVHRLAAQQAGGRIVRGAGEIGRQIIRQVEEVVAARRVAEQRLSQHQEGRVARQPA